MIEWIKDVPVNVWFFVAAALISLAAYLFLILIPTMRAYGKWPEKVAAGFLTLFILGTLVTIGVVGGMAWVFFSNDVSGIVPWATG